MQNPWAEIDYKTSGGHDQYNAMQLAVNRRSAGGLAINAQYTLGKSTGNTGGSNEADTAANNARTADQFDLRRRVQQVRRPPYVQLQRAVSDSRTARAARTDPTRPASVRRCSAAGKSAASVNARSGVPINVLITRPDILYFDGTNYFANPAAGRMAVINTPGGGNTRNVRRPDLVPGVDPFLVDRPELLPQPGRVRDSQARNVRQPRAQLASRPRLHQADLLVSKKFGLVGASNFEFRMEVFNIFNNVNYSNPIGGLPSVIPGSATTEANTLQPGQAYTPAAAGQFGKLTSTVSRTVGLGTSRQIQFAFRLNF